MEAATKTFSKARPIQIECAYGPLAGFFHSCNSQSEIQDTAVLLCYPLGYEAICSYKSYRYLAQTLSSQGFDTLRFDYHGCGDSSGTDRDARRMDAWTDSIKAAAKALRELTGLKRIAIFGVRLGASLALKAASEISEIDSVILWAPLMSGKSYLREMKAFRRLAEKDFRCYQRLNENDEEAGGFLISEETMADLTNFELLSLTGFKNKNILLLPRVESEKQQDLNNYLTSLGANVTVASLGGYDEMMVDAHTSVIPKEVCATLSQWLSAHSTAKARVESLKGPDTNQCNLLPEPQVKETPRYFGEQDELFGILTEGVRAGTAATPAVIFLNAGAVHHIGPNRMYTTLARSWAKNGVTSLRMDLSAIGESEGEEAPEKSLYSTFTVRDVQLAMEFMQRERGVERFILLGLCSGAYVAFHTALVSPRVAAHILINPQTFSWKEGDSIEVINASFRDSRYYQKALFRKESWIRALQGKIQYRYIASVIFSRMKEKLLQVNSKVLNSIFGLGENGSVLQTFQGLCKRKVQTCLIYSRDDAGLHYLETHLGRRAKKIKSPFLKFEVISGADHTFTPLQSQQRLEAVLSSYIASFQQSD